MVVVKVWKCWRRKSTWNLYLTAKSEAKKFLEMMNYIEKYFKNPRHIEVQIMSGKNKTVHLGEKRLFSSKKTPKLIEETEVQF